MNIRCHGCGRHFRVRQDKLPAEGARTRCPRCGERLVIAPPAHETDAAVPTQEVETQPPTAAEGELFNLPAADLLATEEDDLFALGDKDSPGQVAAPAPGHDPATESSTASDGPAPARGLRGWLARLFSRES